MSLIPLFDIISVVVPDLKIPASVVDAAAVNPNGTNTLLANGIKTFFIKGNLTFLKGPRSLPRNPPDCIIS